MMPPCTGQLRAALRDGFDLLHHLGKVDLLVAPVAGLLPPVEYICLERGVFSAVELGIANLSDSQADDDLVAFDALQRTADRLL